MSSRIRWEQVLKPTVSLFCVTRVYLFTLSKPQVGDNIYFAFSVEISGGNTSKELRFRYGGCWSSHSPLSPRVSTEHSMKLKLH